MSYILACIYAGGYILFLFLFTFSSICVDGKRIKKIDIKNFFLIMIVAMLWPVFVIALIVSLFYDD